jgi:hypothetical protein
MCGAYAPHMFFFPQVQVFLLLGLFYIYAVLAIAVASKMSAASIRLARSKVFSRRCRVAISSSLILSFLISARRMAGSTSQVCMALTTIRMATNTCFVKIASDH